MRTTDTIHFADEDDIGISSLFRSQLNENLRVSVGDPRVASPSKNLSLWEVGKEDFQPLDRFAEFPLMHEASGNWRKGLSSLKPETTTDRAEALPACKQPV